jgi:hypothetical protein
VAETWLKCTACKNPIPFGALHQVCSVSTCNRPRNPMVFCTVSCWDSHVADARHRESWAVEALAPSKAVWEAAREHHAAPAPAPVTTPVVRRVVGDVGSAPVANPPVTPPAATSGQAGLHLVEVVDRDMLVVVSKMKKYIKDRSGMSCADAVGDVLSEHLRAICDEAIRAAGRAERKTVLERDVPRPPRR